MIATLSAEEMLGVWERGFDRLPHQQAVLLLAAAWPDAAPGQALEQIEMLSIGQRDALLLTLRELTFGPQLTALGACPQCGETVEVEVTTAQLRLLAQFAESGPSPAPGITRMLGDYALALRPLRVADLAAAGQVASAAVTEQLLSRCVLSIEDTAHGQALSRVPEELYPAVLQELASLDAQADLQMAISCSACGRQWQEQFDIVTYFWTELDGWARRMLRDIHGLAWAYGWTEQAILALSPLRRQYYLELAGA